ncbi:unnamed protein product [Rhizoctonia solani]|uniref:ubiquitinyl hydrolase 1 n=1 Tax=Rhizoctonia solani TaxID=456999 RepID=A0A8H3E4X9_9AGAM|nr:unnamed protein product [Rhizoctonia solani]
MNSTLQCLTHIPELEEYLLSGLYKREVNDNPLGVQGQIANVFGALLHHLYPSPNSAPEPATRNYGWRNSANSYAPREFKQTLGKFAPAFSARYARGMYKSTLVCPECQKISITFDPFMYLTLPLPVTKTWRHIVHWVPWDMRKTPLAVEIEMPKDSSYGYLKKLFGRWFAVGPENLVGVVEYMRWDLSARPLVVLAPRGRVWSHKFYKFYNDYMSLTYLAEKDTLVVYELPVPFKSIAKAPPSTTGFTFGAKPKPPPKTDPKSPFLLPVFHLAEQQRNATFGVPFSSCSLLPKLALARASFGLVPSPTEDEDAEGEDVVEKIEPEAVQSDAEVTEIKPDPEADDMKVEVVKDVEMEPANELAAKEEESTGGTLETLGPQPDLFELKLFSSLTTSGIETGFNMNATSARWVDWNAREQMM